MSMTIANHILEIAERNGGEVLRIELIKRLGYGESTVDSVIADLRRQGKLEFVRFGVYRIPDPAASASPAVKATPAAAAPARDNDPPPQASVARARLTAADQVLRAMFARNGEATRAEIISACFEAAGTKDSAIDKAIQQLVDRGALVRVRTGVYGLPITTDQDEKMPEQNQTPTANPPAAPLESTPPPAAAPAPATTDLDMAIRYSGQLTIRRGHQVLELSPREVCDLMDFVGNFRTVISLRANAKEA